MFDFIFYYVVVVLVWRNMVVKQLRSSIGSHFKIYFRSVVALILLEIPTYDLSAVHQIFAKNKEQKS